MAERKTRQVEIGGKIYEECLHCGTLEAIHDDTFNGIGCNISRSLDALGDALGESVMGPRRWARVKGTSDTPETSR